MKALSALLLLLFVGGMQAASAADLPVKALPPAPVPVSDWTGWYVGGNVGGMWNDTRDDTCPTGCFLTSVV